MTGVVTWEMISSIVGALLLAGGLLRWFQGRLAKQEEKYGNQVKALEGKHDAHQKEMNDFKLKVAETYATKEGLTDALHQLQKSIERLTNRVDSWIETNPRRE